jgi:16S rRNA processing protein RimM
LRVGRLSKPHGLKGGIKLELFTDNPELRFVPGAVFHLQVPEDSPWFGRTISMREMRWFNASPVGFFEEITDRTGAEGIVKAILWIDEDTVAQGEEENAWYDHQLVGLDVVRDDVKVGTVAEVQHFPAQDLLVVTTDRGTVLVPFVEAIVPSVDMAAGVVRVTPPTGLFEEAPEIEIPEVDAPESDAGAAADPAPDRTPDGEHPSRED